MNPCVLSKYLFWCSGKKKKINFYANKVIELIWIEVGVRAKPVLLKNNIICTTITVLMLSKETLSEETVLSVLPLEDIYLIWLLKPLLSC